jgi:hypothetical protein
MNPILTKRLSWLVAPWVIFLIWALLTEYVYSHAILRRTTEDRIRYNDQLIQTYTRKFGEVPSSLTELRLFAKSLNKVFQPSDAWGGRLEYLRLGRINYTMRSFGEDGVQNTLKSSPDPGVFRWGQMVKDGLVYDYDAGRHQIRPSVVLFAGADDQERRWHAKLFLDAATGLRRILVRSRSIMNLYMLAPHDGIEEFLFLPGGRYIVFSASGSSRYSDGLWIWDLESDSCANLLEFSRTFGSINPAKHAQALFVALANVTISDQGPIVSAFIVPTPTVERDPHDFFHPKNLHQFVIKDGEVTSHLLPDQKTALQKSFFDYEWMGSSTIASKGTGSGVQRVWQQLPRAGAWDEAMTAWQDFASTHSSSPLAPYAVWSLALFYFDAAKESRDSKESEVLKGYGRELSVGLSRMPAAPGWLKWYGASSVAGN